MGRLALDTWFSGVLVAGPKKIPSAKPGGTKPLSHDQGLPGRMMTGNSMMGGAMPPSMTPGGKVKRNA